MNTLQLSSLLRRSQYTKFIFQGVYSIDTICNATIKVPFCVICNTDYSFNPGKHWVLFCCFNEREIEFFDSLGKDPKTYGQQFVKFMTRYSRMSVYNTKRVQPEDSDLCGQYCVLYATIRCNTLNMYETLVNLLNIDEVKKTVFQMLYLNKLSSESVYNCNQGCLKF